MQSYCSPYLYHLVGNGRPNDHEGNFETLCKILRSQEVLHRRLDAEGEPCAIRIDYSRDLINGEPIDQSVVCFCDIPFGQLSPVHTGKYGLFGVGVDKLKFAEWGGRPVTYVPRRGSLGAAHANRLASDAMAASKALNDYFLADEPDSSTRSKVLGRVAATTIDAIHDVKDILHRDLLPFIKVFDVELKDDDPENFYMEREWRKYGSLRLEITLREAVVAQGFEERLRDEFPNLKVPVRVLTDNEWQGGKGDA